MNFDFADESPKLVMLLYGLVAFAAVVGGLLLLLDAVPTWFARRRAKRCWDQPPAAVRDWTYRLPVLCRTRRAPRATPTA